MAALADAPVTMTTSERERAVLGIDHATAAGLVAAAWQLPGDLVVALRGHHDDAELAGDDPLPAVLHVGCAVASQVLAESPVSVCSPAALARLGLAAVDLEAIAADAKDALRTHAELLNLVAPARR